MAGLLWGPGTLCIFAGLGFGRFALGMLLPSMGASLGLSFSQMGLISTSNFVGYLIAVLLCGKLSARFGARRLIGFALLLVGLSMLCIGASAKLFVIIMSGSGNIKQKRNTVLFRVKQKI